MYSIVARLLQPFPWIVLALGCCLLGFWWRNPDRRRQLRWLLAAYVFLVLDSLPVTALLTNRVLERQFVRLSECPPGTRAIVVLGGGVHQALSAEGKPALDYSSLIRSMRAAELYRKASPCLVVVSGGFPDCRPGMAKPGALMAEYLRGAGVREEDLVMEEESENTAQNAAVAMRILREHGIDDNIVVVSSAAHLWRAEQLFRKQGAEVTPIGCDYHSDTIDLNPFLFVPTASAIKMNQDVFHEFVGVIYGWLRGQL